jgi:hypothetical protein
MKISNLDSEYWERIDTCIFYQTGDGLTKIAIFILTMLTNLKYWIQLVTTNLIITPTSQSRLFQKNIICILSAMDLCKL